MRAPLALRAAIISLLVFLGLIVVWHIGTMQRGPTPQKMDPEYAKLMGSTVTHGKSAVPGPGDVGAKIWQHLQDPFYDRGTNDKGIGIQLAYSIARVLTGYLLALAAALPIGFLIGMSPLMARALDPFIRDPETHFTARLDALGPLHHQGLEHFGDIRHLHLLSVAECLLNTAFGVATVRREWLNVGQDAGDETRCAPPCASSCLRRPRQSSLACVFRLALLGW